MFKLLLGMAAVQYESSKACIEWVGLAVGSCEAFAMVALGSEAICRGNKTLMEHLDGLAIWNGQSFVLLRWHFCESYKAGTVMLCGYMEGQSWWYCGIPTGCTPIPWIEPRFSGF